MRNNPLLKGIGKLNRVDGKLETEIRPKSKKLTRLPLENRTKKPLTRCKLSISKFNTPQNSKKAPKIVDT